MKHRDKIPLIVAEYMKSRKLDEVNSFNLKTIVYERMGSSTPDGRALIPWMKTSKLFEHYGTRPILFALKGQIDEDNTPGKAEQHD